MALVRANTSQQPRRRKKAPQETAANGKSLVALAAMAPLLLPTITSTITETIRAIRGSPPGGSLRVNGPKKQAQRRPAGPSTASARGTLQSYGNPGVPIGIRRKQISESKCEVTSCDEWAVVAQPATWGTTTGAAIGSNWISPVSGTIHPTSYPEGQQWQNYTVKSVKLHYVPTNSDAQTGMGVMGYVDSPQSATAADAVSTEVKAASLAPNSVSFQLNQPKTLAVPYQRSWGVERNCASSAFVDMNDITPGCLFCYASGGSPTNVGRIFVEITYTLLDRRPVYAGSGLAAQAYEACVRATTVQSRAEARLKLLNAIRYIHDGCVAALEVPQMEPAPGISERELTQGLSDLLRAPTDGARGKPRSC